MENEKRIKYSDWMEDWIRNKKYYVKESTYASYSNNVYNHIIPGLGDYYLDELNHKIIQNYILELFKTGKKIGGGLSKKTVKDITVIIKDSLRKAINEEKIKHFELVFNYPKDQTNNKKIYILTKREQTKITNYVMNNMNNRNIGFIISLYTGLRIGEVCALKWNDIDFKKNMLSVNKTIQRIYIKEKDIKSSKIIITSPKTKTANREIPINKKFLEILKTVKTNNSDYVVSGNEKCLEPRTYRKYFLKTIKQARVKKFNFHSFRHTFATNCISLGIDYKTVSELLGHATVNITLNLYVHPRLSQKRKCIDMICKVFQEKY